MELEQLIEPKAVQKALRCSLAKIYKMAQRGDLPSVRIPQEGGKRFMLRFRASDVTELIEKNYRRAQS